MYLCGGNKNTHDMAYASLSSDIVQSTTLSVADLKRLHDYILLFLNHISHYHGSNLWGRLVKGDEVEIVTDRPNDILRVALLFKCYLKSFEPSEKTGADFRRYGARIAIGIGDLRINDSNNGLVDGEAIYCSGRALSSLSEGKKSGQTLILSSANAASDDALNAMLALVDALFNKMTRKQCIIIFHKLKGRNEKDIAQRLKISQPTVNKSVNSVSWTALSKALDYFEKYNF